MRTSWKLAAAATGLGVAVAGGAQTAVADEPKVPSLAELEPHVRVAGVTVKAVKGLFLKVEGYDTSNREVELLVDRRSGKILSHEIDDQRLAQCRG